MPHAGIRVYGGYWIVTVRAPDAVAPGFVATTGTGSRPSTPLQSSFDKKRHHSYADGIAFTHFHQK